MTRLADLLASLSTEVGATRVVLKGTTEYRRDGSPFAAVSQDGMEFQLDLEVAEAAARTPDTTPSSRGPRWVNFRPATVDRLAEDRARAWFLSAWRAAGG